MTEKSALSFEDIITDPFGKDLRNLALEVIENKDLRRTKARLEFEHDGEEYAVELMIKKADFELPENHEIPEGFEMGGYD